MLLTLQVVLIVLKLAGILMVNWWVVLIPTGLILGGFVLGACVTCMASAKSR